MTGHLRTFEEFVIDANIKHHNKYSYKKESYVNTHTLMDIICPKHGPFQQTPHNHLSGYGCRKCANEANRKPVYGVGIVDIDIDNSSKVRLLWKGILERCYSQKLHKIEPTYKECEICPEWIYLSNFKEWFDENYIEGYHLDKDILVKDNKIYSPETCCFVPQRLNNLLTKRKASRNSTPIGVTIIGNKFASQISKGDKRIRLGFFDTPEEAFLAYKNAKEQYVKELALEYFEKGLITERVKNALLYYQVEITD